LQVIPVVVSAYFSPASGYPIRHQKVRRAQLSYKTAILPVVVKPLLSNHQHYKYHKARFVRYRTQPMLNIVLPVPAGFLHLQNPF